MIAPTAPRATAFVAPAASPTTTPREKADAPLLADSPGMSAQGVDDAMALLYTLETKLDSLSTKQGEQQVTSETKAKDAEVQQQQAAIQRLADAIKAQANESHSFWHQLAGVAEAVAEVGAIAASVALAVASCGSATAIAVIAVSVVATGVGKTGVLGSTASQILGAAGAVGLAIASLGTSAGADALTVAIAQGTSGGAALAEGTHDIAAGVDQKNVKDDEANQADAQADAKSAEQKMMIQQALIQDVIAALQDAHGTKQKTEQSVLSAIATNDQTSVTLSSFGRA